MEPTRPGTPCSIEKQMLPIRPGDDANISAEQAKTKAELEYERYRVFLDSRPRAVDWDFEKAASVLKKLPKPKKPKPPKP
ncbi:MAG: hypothetical protein H7067_14890 [Burkholderiales bacterium]|nr:hypothetical protein [Opitutaceae bacterium]